MNNFKSRVLIGGLYVIVTTAALLTDISTGVIFLLLIQWLCLNEFYRIIIGSSFTERLVPLIVGSLIFIEVYANQNSEINLGYFSYLVIPMVIGFMIYLISFQKKNFVRSFIGMIAGWVYVSCSLALLLRNGNLIFDLSNEELLPYSGIQILVVFILIWVNDTGAYLVGKKFGKRALAPTISPKKTLAGLYGGVLSTLALTIPLQYFFPFLTLTNYLVLAVIVVISSTLGDLFESKIKRELGLKDSGSALGGHGGFLDRFDSVLFAGPMSYFYMLHLAIM